MDRRCGTLFTDRSPRFSGAPMSSHSRFSAFVLLVSFAGCGSPLHTGAPDTASASHAQLFDGLGHHHRTITTSSPEAQRFFDQGLTWAYSFNHDEAIRSFK